MKQFAHVFAIAILLAFSSTNANAIIINNQVDKIQLPPDAFTNLNDVYSLTVTGPINATATITLNNIAGCNPKHWPTYFHYSSDRLGGLYRSCGA